MNNPRDEQKEAARMGEKPTTDQLRGMIGPQLDFPISGLHFEDGKPRIHVWCSDALAVIEYLDAHDQLLARCAELEKALGEARHAIAYAQGDFALRGGLSPDEDSAKTFTEHADSLYKLLDALRALASQGEGR